MRIKQRLDALEAMRPRGPLRWLRVVVPVGGSVEAAEAEHRAIHGDSVGLVIRKIVAPGGNGR